jgi:hypothetical protein
MLLNTIITYHERQGQGLYLCDEPEMHKLVAQYKTAKDYLAIESTLKELFFIAHQGRRPWSLSVEQVFLKLTLIGCEFLTYLRSVHTVAFETYHSIDPLSHVVRLESEAERMQDWEDGENGYRRDCTLDIFYKLIHWNTLVFCQWATDYPGEVKLPDLDTLKYILEIDIEEDFIMILQALAKTRRPDVKAILLELQDDEEYQVRRCSQRLHDECFADHKGGR